MTSKQTMTSNQKIQVCSRLWMVVHQPTPNQTQVSRRLGLGCGANGPCTFKKTREVIKEKKKKKYGYSIRATDKHSANGPSVFKKTGEVTWRKKKNRKKEEED